MSSGVDDPNLARLREPARRADFDVAAALRVALAPALALAGVAVALVSQVSLTHDTGISSAGWGFVLAAALFAASAFVIVGQGVTDADAESAFVLPRYWEIAAFAAVIGIALFFRFFRFMDFPQGLWYDEAVNGTDALSIIDRDHLTVWRESNFGHSTIFFYLLIVSYKLFGYTVFAMRLVPAIAGMAAVIAFYFLARWLLGPIPALVATAFLAVSRFAVTFSRISWEASLQPLFEILAVYFFVRALETKRALYFFLAGGALAAGIYTYLAFRFVPVVLLFFLLYIAVSQRELLLRNVRGLLIYGVSFVIVVLPLAQYAVQNQDQFLARTRDINVFKEIDKTDSYEPLRHNIKATLKMLNVQGDLNGRHNLPNAPMMDDVSAALLVLGLAVCAWSIRNWRKGAMAGWLALALVPGALTISIENPSAIRAVGAIPPMYLIPGLAVGFMYRTLSPTRSGRLLFAVLAVGLVGASTVQNYRDFFDKQAHNEQVYDAFGSIPTQVAQLAAQESGSKNVYVSREFNGHPAFLVLTRGKKVDYYTPAANVVFPRSNKDYLLILDPRQLGIVPTLRTLYPGLTAVDDTDEWGRLQFTKVTIPAGDVEALHRVDQTITPGGGGPQTSQQSAAHTWTDAEVSGGAATVEWRGNLWVGTAPGNVAFRLNSPGLISLEVDGKEIASGANEVDVPQAPMTFGEHKVRVVANATKPGDSTMKVSIDGRVTDASDSLYSTSTGDRGFQAAYRTGRDFTTDPVQVTHIPFAISALALSGLQAVDYRGVLDVPVDGDYGFAIDTGVPAQILVDDQLVVDSGGAHAPRRSEGSTALTAGQHLVSIQFSGVDRAEWALFLKAPAEDWKQADGSEFAPPTGAYRPPAVVTLDPDPTWTAGGRKIEGIDAPAAVTSLPDGTTVVGAADRLAFVSPSGVTRTVKVAGVSEIADLDVTPSGAIAVLDRASHSLVIVDQQGTVQQQLGDSFASTSGLAIQGNDAYVTSPAGGVVYKVPLDGSGSTILPISNADATQKAVQPSDIAVAPDGTILMTDFDRHKIVVSADGVTGKSTAGLPGTGTQVPHVALYKGVLLLATDPLNQRIVMYDRAGKQRGVFVFAFSVRSGARPVGISVTSDGLVYAADPELGVVYRLKIKIPPEAIDLAQ